MEETQFIKDNLELLKKVHKLPVFQPFEESEIKRLLELSKIRKYRPEEVIIQEGSYDSWLYFLISGKVKIEKYGEIFATMQRAGDVFGEMSGVDGRSRSASVVAVKDTLCIATDTSYIIGIQGRDRVLISYILYRIYAGILADRLRTANEELINARGGWELK